MKTVTDEDPDEDPIEVTIDKQKTIALAKLNEYKVSKIHLKRPVFFVSGWGDESCTWWIGPKEGSQGISQWIDQIADNREQATFITFEKETASCKSFSDFGDYLKNQIPAVTGSGQQFDLVGYSMGGLDIRAALTQGNSLLNCQTCITADTPHQGNHFGGILETVETYAPDLMNQVDNIPLYQQKQAANMDPNSGPMKIINSLANRQLFLSRVNKFYQFKGTRDALVMGSCFMDLTGLGARVRKR